jgi:hypothetical protein
MPNRRQVMAGGLLGCALGALPAQAAQLIEIGNAAILIGNGFADGVLFQDGCGQAVRAGQCDVALTALASGGFRTPRVIAIAQQSDAFPLQQLLAAEGYRSVFSAEHLRSTGRIEHRLLGNAALVGAVASGLSRTGANWASALALTLRRPGFSYSEARLAQKVATPAHAGPAFLSSFLFERMPV